MGKVTTAALASVCILGITLAASVASAATCPASIGGSTGYNQQFTVAAADSCAFGNGKLNGNTNDDALVAGYDSITSTYPTAPTLGVDPIPEGYQFVQKINQDGSVVGSNVFTATDFTPPTGTLTFTQDLDNALLVIVDGQSANRDPIWSVFTLGSITAGDQITWSSISGNISHFIIYATPLPPALILFATALIGMTILSRRRVRREKLVAA